MRLPSSGGCSTTETAKQGPDLRLQSRPQDRPLILRVAQEEADEHGIPALRRFSAEEFPHLREQGGQGLGKCVSGIGTNDSELFHGAKIRNPHQPDNT